MFDLLGADERVGVIIASKSDTLEPAQNLEPEAILSRVSLCSQHKTQASAIATWTYLVASDGILCALLNISS